MQDVITYFSSKYTNDSLIFIRIIYDWKVTIIIDEKLDYNYHIWHVADTNDKLIVQPVTSHLRYIHLLHILS